MLGDTSVVTLTGRVDVLNEFLAKLYYTSGAFVRSADGLTVQIFKAFSLATPERDAVSLPSPYQPVSKQKDIAAERSQKIWIGDYAVMRQWCTLTGPVSSIVNEDSSPLALATPPIALAALTPPSPVQAAKLEDEIVHPLDHKKLFLILGAFLYVPNRFVVLL